MIVRFSQACGPSGGAVKRGVPIVATRTSTHAGRYAGTRTNAGAGDFHACASRDVDRGAGDAADPCARGDANPAGRGADYRGGSAAANASAERTLGDAMLRLLPRALGAAGRAAITPVEWRRAHGGAGADQRCCGRPMR